MAFSELATTGAAPTSETVRQALKATIWRQKLIGSIDLISQILPSFAFTDSEPAVIPCMNDVPERNLFRALSAKLKAFSAVWV